LPLKVLYFITIFIFHKKFSPFTILSALRFIKYVIYHFFAAGYQYQTLKYCTFEDRKISLALTYSLKRCKQYII